MRSAAFRRLEQYLPLLPLLSSDVKIEQASNHLLILRVVFLCLFLEIVYTPLTQPKGNLDRIFLENEFSRRRQKILDHPDLTQGLIDTRKPISLVKDKMSYCQR
jgi:hypothetical protein